MLYKLSEVIAQIQERQVFKVYFADTNWFITMSGGTIAYCNENGIPDNTISLTFSNLRAKYELVEL